MKFLMPRVLFALPLFCLVIAGVGFYLAWQELSGRGIFLDEEARAGNIGALVIFPFFFWYGLYLLCRCFANEYSLWVLGETFSAKLALPSGKSALVKPLSGLSGKLLMVRLSCQLPEELQQKIRPLHFYARLPPAPYVRYTLTLFGVEEEKQIQVVKRVLIQKLESIWGANKQSEDSERDDRGVDIPVEQTFASYILQVKAEAGYKKSANDESFEPVLRESKLTVKVRLAVGLKVRDAKHYNDCSIRTAHIQAL